jgi:hypothetical protein
MKRCTPIGTLLLASAAALSACDGSVAADDPNDPLKNVECEADVTLSGTFQTSVSPPPVATDGCVPDGTWTINTTVASMGTCATVDVRSQYVLTVVNSAPMGERPIRTVTLQGAGASEEVTANIHAGGDGECLLSFESITPIGDGKFHVVLLHPVLDGEVSLTAVTQGEEPGHYQLWTKHP